VLAIIDYEREPGTRVAIWLERLDAETYQRQPGSKLAILGQQEEEEAEPLSMYLVVDNDRGESQNQKASGIAVTSVRSDFECVISTVCLFTRDTFRIVRGPSSSLKYLQNLIIKEGEAAYLQISNVQGCPNAIAGLRRGRPALRFVDYHNPRHRDLSEELRSDTSELWESAGDFDQCLSSPGFMYQMTAKKTRYQEQDSSRWDITIEVYECECGAIDSRGQDCVCDSTNRHWTSQTQYFPTKQYPCACSVCQYERGRKAEQDRMEQITRIWREMLVDPRSGRHYMECPCGVCEVESKIVFVAAAESTVRSRVKRMKEVIRGK